MRIVFIGAGEIVVQATRMLLDRGDEVVIIEVDKDRIDSLSDDLSCSFLHGDGSNPHILKQALPEETDVLICMTDNDQANIIASVVGRSLGFKSIVTNLLDSEFEKICRELRLESTIIPSRTIARYLTDMVSGVDIFELSTAIKDDARLFCFTAGEKEAGKIENLELPEGSRAICYYRDGKFHLVDPDSTLKADDEIVILAHARHLKDFRERWKQ